jgi:hypothetical protein
MLTQKPICLIEWYQKSNEGFGKPRNEEKSLEKY